MAMRVLFLLGASVLSGCGPATVIQIQGDQRLWHPLSITISGPTGSETGDPNPFLDYRMEVTLVHESGEELRVPGYFAADGDAADSGATSGDQWRAHFLPFLPGQWKFTVSLRRAVRAPLNTHDPGEPAPGDGTSGEFVITEDNRTDDPLDPRDRGKLRYAGGRYLQYAQSGEYFLKSGTDSPENFLAFTDFDYEEGGHEEAGAPRRGEAAVAPRHRYERHVQDWNAGDPSWRGGLGKGIVGALNYLHSKGVNSVYFLTMNIGGDGDDVWPYSNRDEHYRFDCSRLDQWNIVFDHMDRLGQMLHVVLTETENESLFEIKEGGSFADSRRVYYRELIARFAHHSALVWNIGEENGWDNKSPEEGLSPGRGNSDEQRKAFARFLRENDPYDNPIVVHTLPGDYDRIYDPLLGFDSINGPSLQMGNVRQTHSETLKWIRRSDAAGQPWFVCLDEVGPAEDGVLPDSEDPEHNDVRRFGLWGNLMAGGSGAEWYFGYNHPHNDLNLEDFRSRDEVWRQTATAVRFFQENLPFSTMRSSDELVSSPDAYCLANPGEDYVVYLGQGGTTDLEVTEGRYQVLWFDPIKGGALQEGSTTTLQGPGKQSIGRPPGQSNRDWVALVRK